MEPYCENRKLLNAMAYTDPQSGNKKAIKAQERKQKKHESEDDKFYGTVDKILGSFKVCV